MTRFVAVYVLATGRKQMVPAHWMTHPVLSRGLRLTPRQRARDRATSGPAITTMPARPENERSDDASRTR